MSGASSVGSAALRLALPGAPRPTSKTVPLARAPTLEMFSRPSLVNVIRALSTL